MWTVHTDRRSGAREVTAAFPTGIDYTGVDWTTGSVPASPTAPPALLPLAATRDLRPGWEVDGLLRAGTNSVAYTREEDCDAAAGTTSLSFYSWTPTTGSIEQTSAPCDDTPDPVAADAHLVAWKVGPSVDGSTTLSVAPSGSSDAEVANWTTQQEAPDIGWRDSVDHVVGDGSTILFQTSVSGCPQLWQIVDIAGHPHAAQIPLPTDAQDLLDADAGRFVLAAHGGLVVEALDGTVVTRLPAVGHRADRTDVRMGGDLVGALTGTTLRVYAAPTGTLVDEFPLAHAAGDPRLLSIGYGYAVYATGLELHLVRLRDGVDRVANLAGQAGPLAAQLMPAGLAVSYDVAYAPQPGHIIFVPTANLP